MSYRKQYLIKQLSSHTCIGLKYPKQTLFIEFSLHYLCRHHYHKDTVYLRLLCLVLSAVLCKNIQCVLNIGPLLTQFHSTKIDLLPYPQLGAICILSIFENGRYFLTLASTKINTLAPVLSQNIFQVMLIIYNHKARSYEKFRSENNGKRRQQRGGTL